jgi:hypothetical protein
MDDQTKKTPASEIIFYSERLEEALRGKSQDDALDACDSFLFVEDADADTAMDGVEAGVNMAVAATAAGHKIFLANYGGEDSFRVYFIAADEDAVVRLAESLRDEGEDDEGEDHF